MKVFTFYCDVFKNKINGETEHTGTPISPSKCLSLGWLTEKIRVHLKSCEFPFVARGI